MRNGPIPLARTLTSTRIPAADLHVPVQEHGRRRTRLRGPHLRRQAGAGARRAQGLHRRQGRSPRRARHLHPGDRIRREEGARRRRTRGRTRGADFQDDDLAVAKAVFSDDRLAKFEAALEQKFKDSAGTDQTLERELEAAGATPLEACKARAARADAAAKAETAYRAAEDAAVKATFDQQNEWMDGTQRPEQIAAATGAVSGAVAGSKEINAARDAVDATRAVPPVVRAKAVSAPRTRRAVCRRGRAARAASPTSARARSTATAFTPTGVDRAAQDGRRCPGRSRSR